jgi:hypothetical protein
LVRYLGQAFLTQNLLLSSKSQPCKQARETLISSIFLNRENLLPHALRNKTIYKRHTHLVREDHPVFSRRRVSSVYGILSSSSSATSSSSTFKNSGRKEKRPIYQTEELQGSNKHANRSKCFSKLKLL